ncbi:MAG: photosystem II S4 domain protein [Firmicutes bacterium]|nr:photosystem II S4 domain protein [Bacillota bacterium]
MDRQRLTAHLVDDHEKSIALAVIDAAELAWKTNHVQVTCFYDPYEQKVAKSVLSLIPEVNVLTFGGYRRAERNRLAITPQFFLTEAVKLPIRVIEVKGNFDFVKISHRDFLGSLLGLGIKRNKVGDLLCQDDGCQVIVADEIADYILLNWKKVHQVPVRISEIDPQQLVVEPERVKEIKTTVASMRLDAIAASGFGLSRTKMAREIKGERVKVNWKVISNPAYDINVGDVLSVPGRGRVVVKRITGTTKKGRTGLILQRLI